MKRRAVTRPSVRHDPKPPCWGIPADPPRAVPRRRAHGRCQPDAGPRRLRRRRARHRWDGARAPVESRRQPDPAGGNDAQARGQPAQEPVFQFRARPRPELCRGAPLCAGPVAHRQGLLRGVWRLGGDRRAAGGDRGGRGGGFHPGGLRARRADLCPRLPRELRFGGSQRSPTLRRHTFQGRIGPVHLAVGGRHLRLRLRPRERSVVTRCVRGPAEVAGEFTERRAHQHRCPFHGNSPDPGDHPYAACRGRRGGDGADRAPSSSRRPISTSTCSPARWSEWGRTSRRSR